MSTDAEFGRFDLALGSVRGLRSFRVDPDGTLRGVVHADEWTPGENTATCHTPTPGTCACGAGVTVVSTMLGGFITMRCTEHTDGCTGETPCAPPEQLPSPDCACGFYAYTDRSNEYANPSTATAVVEGYGRTIVGTRGFRAQKARIVALAIAPRSAAPRPGSWKYKADRALWLSLAGLYAVFAVLNVVDGDWWVVAIEALCLGWAAWQLRDIARARRLHAAGGCANPGHPARKVCGCSRRMRAATAAAHLDASRDQLDALIDAFSPNRLKAVPAGALITPAQRARIAERYRVPIYASTDELLAAHPLGDHVATTTEGDPR